MSHCSLHIALIRIEALSQSGKKVFFQKMENGKSDILNGMTLKGDILLKLDFNSAPQDIVLNCSDGQV